MALPVVNSGVVGFLVFTLNLNAIQLKCCSGINWIFQQFNFLGGKVSYLSHGLLSQHMPVTLFSLYLL